MIRDAEEGTTLIETIYVLLSSNKNRALLFRYTDLGLLMVIQDVSEAGRKVSHVVVPSNLIVGNDISDMSTAVHLAEGFHQLDRMGPVKR